MRFWIVAVVALVSGCVDTSSVRCGSVWCPSDSKCGPNNECVPPGCGDGVVAGKEECDSTVEKLKCTDLGFYGGPSLTCSPLCTIDTSACVGSCGDHAINGLELCDGIPPLGRSCVDFGYDIGAVGCSAGCSPEFAVCDRIGWQIGAGGSQNELRGVWGNQAHAFAVGLSGTILELTEGAWQPVTSPTTEDLFGIWGEGNRAFAVGAKGTIVAWDGTTWTKMSSPTTNTLTAISGSTAQNVVAVGLGGTIVRYDGTAWNVNNSLTTADLFGVWAGPLFAVAVGNQKVLRGTAGGWTEVTGHGAPLSIRGVFAAGGNVFLGGDGGYMAVLDTSGTFTPLPKPPGFPIQITYSIWASSGTDVFFALGNGHLLHWDGQYMLQQDVPTVRSLFGVYGTGPARVVATTRGGEVLEFNGTDREIQTLGPSAFMDAFAVGQTVYTAGGSTTIYKNDGGGWVAYAQDPGVLVSSGWGTGTDIYVASDVGIYRSSGGAAFTHPSNMPTNAIYGITSPSLHLWAVGDSYTESTDGTTWSTPPIAGNRVNGANTLRGIWGFNDTWYAVGDNGTIMTRAPGATNWTLIPTAFTVNFTAVWGSGLKDIFAVSAKGVIVHWDGTTWRQQHTTTGEILNAVKGTSGQDVFATGTSGTVLHYDGLSWTEVSRLPFDPTGLALTTRDVTFVGGGSVAAGAIEIISRARVPVEERCEDPWDNDSDGLTNCADPDCTASFACLRGGACQTKERVDCTTHDLAASTFTGVARVDDIPCVPHSTPGPEASFRYIADVTGSVTVTIADSTGELDLAVTEALGGACDLTKCTAASLGNGTQAVTFNAVAGSLYFIVVDGPAYTAHDFTLNVDCQ